MEHKHSAMSFLISIPLLLLLHFTSEALAREGMLVVSTQMLQVSPLPEYFSEMNSLHDPFAEEAVSAIASEQILPYDENERDTTWNKETLALTVRLMHRDAEVSPLRNHSHSPEQLLRHRLRRDAARARELTARARRYVRTAASAELDQTELEVASPAQKRHSMAAAGFTGPLMSGLKQGSGEYFTRLGVGTPAKQVFMVVDTGSDIMWLQCAPCVDCYDQTDPVFNPALSSSFRQLPCSSPTCSMLELHGCEARTNQCLYQVAYGDGSFTEGDFSLEVVSFRGAAMRNVAMGCGHDNEGLFAGAAGLFGLGGGSLSFPSQVGRAYSRVFSYCLMDRDKQGFSTLNFGGGPGAFPRGTQFTPLLRNPNLQTFYYVSLTGISVGGNLLTIPATAFKMDTAGGGGVILDSGTSVTRLIEVAYGPLRSAFRAATRGLPFVGGFSLFDTCYDLSGKSAVTLPKVALHFQGGAVMDLPAKNYMVPVDTKGTFCLAFASTTGELSIIGNIQQQGFRIIFDGVGTRLGFAPAQC